MTHCPAGDLESMLHESYRAGYHAHGKGLTSVHVTSLCGGKLKAGLAQRRRTHDRVIIHYVGFGLSLRPPDPCE